MTPEACGEAGVILERNSSKPDAEIGRLLAHRLDLHPTDAIARVRYGGGLVIDNLSEEMARDVVDGLQRIGVKARVISMGLWSYVPRGVRAFSLELGDDALGVRLVGGRKVSVPRGEIFALQLYGLLAPLPAVAPALSKRDKAARESVLGAAGPALAALGMPSRQSESGSLRPRGQALHERLVESSLERLELHVALYADPFGPVRVQKNDFDFTCLDAERAEHSLDNFLLLLERLLAYLPNAWNRERAGDFLDKLDPRRIHLFKPEEAENLERWLYEHSRLEAAARAVAPEDAT